MEQSGIERSGTQQTETGSGDGSRARDTGALLGRALYAAGYTEPRLRTWWGSPVSDAIARNNAAPAIRFCRRVLAGSEMAGSELAGSPPAGSLGESADIPATPTNPATQTNSATPTNPDTLDVRLAAIAMAFWFHQRVDEQHMLLALGAEALTESLELGLLEVDATSNTVVAPFALIPYDLPAGVPRGQRHGDENLYLVSDHGTLVNPGVLGGEFVLGLGGAGRTLVGLTPRDEFDLSADIGTGCGIQALLLARHSTRVIATDISERALRLARLSARLNEVHTIEFRLGSLLEPVTETVDLLVSNPPFVITPRTPDDDVAVSTESSSAEVNERQIFEYRDGGMVGDDLVRSLFAAIPAALNPGGRSVCLGNWEVKEQPATGPAAGPGAGPASGPATQPVTGPATWVSDPDTSVFVVEREVVDPISYAETWARDGGIPRATSEWQQTITNWLEDFASRSVSEIVFGYVWMQKNDHDSITSGQVGALRGLDQADDPHPGTFNATVRTTSALANNPLGIGHFLSTVVGLRSWLEQADAEEIALTTFTRSPDLVEHRHFVPGDSDPNSITLEQGIGFGQVFDLDTALAGFVSVADGTLSLRQIARALAQLLEVNPTALEDQLIAQVRGLVAAGALLPTEKEA